MKPIVRLVLAKSGLFQGNLTGAVIAKIKGSTKRLGHQYQDATVLIYNKDNMQPIAVRKPDQNGNYQFSGLNTDLKTFIVAFDNNKQFNAVIQDNVVPK